MYANGRAAGYGLPIRPRIPASHSMNPFRLEMQSSVRIAVPLQHAWDVFADIRRWTDWCDACLRADVDESFDWTPGQEIGLRFRMAGVGVPFPVRVTESESRSRIAWASTKFSVTAVRTFTFSADPTPGGPGESTVVTDHKLFTSPVLPLRLFYPRPIIRRMTESMLADLKSECERMSGQ